MHTRVSSGSSRRSRARLCVLRGWGVRGEPPALRTGRDPRRRPGIRRRRAAPVRRGGRRVRGLLERDLPPGRGEAADAARPPPRRRRDAPGGAGEHVQGRAVRRRDRPVRRRPRAERDDRGGRRVGARARRAPVEEHRVFRRRRVAHDALLRQGRPAGAVRPRAVGRRHRRDDVRDAVALPRAAADRAHAAAPERGGAHRGVRPARRRAAGRALPRARPRVLRAQGRRLGPEPERRVQRRRQLRRAGHPARVGVARGEREHRADHVRGPGVRGLVHRRADQLGRAPRAAAAADRRALPLQLDEQPAGPALLGLPLQPRGARVLQERRAAAPPGRLAVRAGLRHQGVRRGDGRRARGDLRADPRERRAVLLRLGRGRGRRRRRPVHLAAPPERRPQEGELRRPRARRRMLVRRPALPVRRAADALHRALGRGHHGEGQQRRAAVRRAHAADRGRAHGRLGLLFQPGRRRRLRQAQARLRPPAAAPAAPRGVRRRLRGLGHARGRRAGGRQGARDVHRAARRGGRGWPAARRLQD